MDEDSDNYNSIDWIVGLAASLLLLVSLAIHVVTFWSFNLADRFPWLWLLHLGIFVFIIPLQLRQWFQQRRVDEELVTLTSELSNSKPAGAFPSVSGFPSWLTAIYLSLGVYVVVNFFVFILGAEGSPYRRGEEYTLENHGKVVREISREAYDARWLGNFMVSPATG